MNREYIKVGKGAGWVGKGGKSPAISTQITLTEGDLRTLFAHLNSKGEVSLGLGLFGNPQYIEGESMPAWTGSGSIRVTRENVAQVTPIEGAKAKRVAKAKADKALEPKAPIAPTMSAVLPKNNSSEADIGKIVAAITAAMGKNNLPY